jgi:hypothetical protein
MFLLCHLVWLQSNSKCKFGRKSRRCGKTFLNLPADIIQLDRHNSFSRLFGHVNNRLNSTRMNRILKYSGVKAGAFYFVSQNSYSLSLKRFLKRPQRAHTLRFTIGLKSIFKSHVMRELIEFKMHLSSIKN